MPGIPRRAIPLIIAIVCGLLAIFLINIYLRQQQDKAREEALLRQEDLGRVIVARQDIPAGTTVTENMLREEKINKEMLQPRAATSAERVIDKITLVPISKGEQILLNKLSISSQETTLSMRVPRGKRAITVSIDNISSVGGLIRPGDHVDLVGIVPVPAMTMEGKQITQMSSLPLFQDVLVLAVGSEFMPTGERREERVVSPAITLALTPQEANLISFVQDQGKIRLVLRSAGDTNVEAPTPASWDTLFMTVMPQAFTRKPPEAPKPQRKVEIYRGLQKEVRILE